MGSTARPPSRHRRKDPPPSIKRGAAEREGHMHARVNTTRVAPDQLDDFATAIKALVPRAHRQTTGLQSAMVLVDRATDKVVIVSRCVELLEAGVPPLPSRPWRGPARDHRAGVPGGMRPARRGNLAMARGCRRAAGNLARS